MRKYISILSVFILSGYLLSCDSDYYSCDPVADLWVKENLTEVRTMTRSAWLELDESGPIKKAAYVALDPGMKQKFWADKITEVIDDFSWNQKERDHLNLLLDYVYTTDVFDRKEVPEEFEIFVYKWNEYAVNELGWSRKLIYAITASGGRLLDKSGKIQGISGGMLEKKRIKTNTEKNEEPDCGCSQKDDLCVNFDGMHSSSCKSHNCKKVRGCGTFGIFPCDGICR